jgi:hypothetical protein
VQLAAMKPREVGDTLTEIRFLASLRHPHVVTYHESFLDPAGAELWLVMEYAALGDLAGLVERHSKAGTRIAEPQVGEGGGGWRGVVLRAGGQSIAVAALCMRWCPMPRPAGCCGRWRAPWPCVCGPQAAGSSVWPRVTTRSPSRVAPPRQTRNRQRSLGTCDWHAASSQVDSTLADQRCT